MAAGEVGDGLTKDRGQKAKGDGIHFGTKGEVATRHWAGRSEEVIPLVRRRR